MASVHKFGDPAVYPDLKLYAPIAGPPPQFPAAIAHLTFVLPTQSPAYVALVDSN